MPRPAGLPKTGGRTAGTPNKANAAARTFFQGVFQEAFADPGFRVELVGHLKTFRLDPGLLKAFLAYAYGSPARQVDHTHSGTVSLARIIAGDVAIADGEADDDEPEGA